jgi:hypothetical protein
MKDDTQNKYYQNHINSRECALNQQTFRIKRLNMSAKMLLTEIYDDHGYFLQIQMNYIAAINSFHL